ncbi:MAG: hypothetical protein ACPKQO_08870 [Nitrososphaeraceae archaeon]
MKNSNLTVLMLLSTVLVLVATMSLDSVYAQEENMTDTKMPKLFAIQHATSGKISEINETAYSLELNDISDKTILFSDRPDRIVKSVTTSDFIGNWSSGEDSFAEDAPNAVLVIDEQKVQQDVIFELFDPVYDVDKKTLKYIISLNNSNLIDLQIEFGSSTLIIDSTDSYWLHPKFCNSTCYW